MEVVIECPICKLYVESAEAQTHVDCHFISPSSEPTLSCSYPDCSATFSSPSQLSDHMKAHELSRSNLRRSTESKDGPKFSAETGYAKQYLSSLQKDWEKKHLSTSQLLARSESFLHSLHSEDTETATPGIIALLRSAFESQKNGQNSMASLTYLCSPEITHFEYGRGDAGWGCGYRNIQMIGSCLVQHSKFKDSIFDGKGFVPTIPMIQAYIEQAWAEGFDREEAQSEFGGRLEGSRRWIGSSEVVVLLRSFGIPCSLVGFAVAANDKEKGEEVTQHEQLIRYIWRYFHRKDGVSSAEEREKGVQVKLHKGPIFLQHEGHSRTIVGIERRKKDGNMILLVLDPKHKRVGLREHLKAGQLRMFRKSVKLIPHERYQLVVIDWESPLITKSGRTSSFLRIRPIHIT